uniref:Uncharacterized protein n=2 Tax=Guillardia theta TaxID=55529 RepID=A0A7S4NVK8_GUITH|mmetsp:Transcript_35092/g.109672  ORF Transcript_35092/g.109672 Transcript_35092/m.109672 type:complete len:103 (+) Transcript_35092:610-918(+)
MLSSLRPLQEECGRTRRELQLLAEEWESAMQDKRFLESEIVRQQKAMKDLPADEDRKRQQSKDSEQRETQSLREELEKQRKARNKAEEEVSSHPPPPSTDSS